MAHDEGLAELFRGDLAQVIGGADTVTETVMFGGLCFMVGGHMTCGVHSTNRGGAMARVGPARMAAAMQIAGVGPMHLGKRVLAGLVDIPAGVMAEDAARHALVALALENARSLPPKT